MSRIDPQTREEAFYYQFEDDLKLLNAVKHNKIAFEKQIQLLKTHIAAYENKQLIKNHEQAVATAHDKAEKLKRFLDGN